MKKLFGLKTDRKPQKQSDDAGAAFHNNESKDLAWKNSRIVWSLVHMTHIKL